MFTYDVFIDSKTENLGKTAEQLVRKDGKPYYSSSSAYKKLY